MDYYLSASRETPLAKSCIYSMHSQIGMLKYAGFTAEEVLMFSQKRDTSKGHEGLLKFRRLRQPTKGWFTPGTMLRYVSYATTWFSVVYVVFSGAVHIQLRNYARDCCDVAGITCLIACSTIFTRHSSPHACTVEYFREAPCTAHCLATVKVKSC